MNKMFYSLALTIILEFLEPYFEGMSSKRKKKTSLGREKDHKIRFDYLIYRCGGRT